MPFPPSIITSILIIYGTNGRRIDSVQRTSASSVYGLSVGLCSDILFRVSWHPLLRTANGISSPTLHIYSSTPMLMLQPSSTFSRPPADLGTAAMTPMRTLGYSSSGPTAGAGCDWRLAGFYQFRRPGRSFPGSFYGGLLFNLQAEKKIPLSIHLFFSPHPSPPSPLP